MIQLRVLGSLDLRGPEGNEVLSVLSRPKHTAVLAYLAIASPRGFHRRDKIAALFWSEVDQEHARTSLRKTVHYLRRSLGEELLLSRGDEEIGLALEQVTCDAVEFQAAVDAGDAAGALDLYRGDLLEGFFLSGCAEFEQWLEEERLRLRELAAVAAWMAAHEQLRAGRITDAERTGQKALGLVATDENEVRRFVDALAQAGDRAAAVRFCERFAQILQDTLDLEPSTETRALEQAIRDSAPLEDAPRRSGQPGAAGGPGASAGTAETETAVLATEEGEAKEKFGPLEISVPAMPSEFAARTRTPEIPERAKRSWAMTVVFVSMVAPLAVGAWLGRGRIGAWVSPSGEIAGAELVENRVLVTLFENQTGEEGLDPTGRLAAGLIHDQLVTTGVVDVLDLGPAVALAEEGMDATSLRRAGADLGAALAVTGSFFAQGDILVIQGWILDVARGRRRTPLGPVSAPTEEPAPALTEIARRAGGAVPYLLHPSNAGWDLTPPRSYAAYAEWETGQRAFALRQYQESATRMSRAFELDSTFVHPLIVQTLALRMLGRYPEADSVYRISEGLRDRATSLERGFLDLNRAHFTGNREGAYRAAEHLAVLMPEVSGPEGEDPAATLLLGPIPGYLGVAMEAIATNRLETALENLPEPEAGRVLGIDTWYMLLTVYHLLGRHEEELAAARMAREQYTDVVDLASREAFALIGLDSIAEALALLDKYHRRGWQHFPILEVACELRAHGYLESSRDVLTQLLGWLDAQPTDPETQRGLRYRKARTLYYLERWREARSIFAELYSEIPEVNTNYAVGVLGQLGVVAAHLGEREEALRISDELVAREIPGYLGWNTAWRAAIAAILGEEERAVNLLRQSYRDGHPYGIWTDYYLDLENLWDHPGFQEFVRPRK